MGDIARFKIQDIGDCQDGSPTKNDIYYQNRQKIPPPQGIDVVF